MLFLHCAFQYRKEVNMCKLDEETVSVFSVCNFKIVKKREHYIEFRSESGQYWCVYMEDKNVALLLHRHHCNDKYHIHYVFDDPVKAVTEILQHERYLKKRNAQKDKLLGKRKLELVF